MISVIIPTYNHCEDLLKPCLESIKKYTSLEMLEVLVVANGCTDNTKEYVESLGKPFRLIWSDKGLGFTKAFNMGFKEAKGNIIIGLNNDIELLAQAKDTWINMLITPFADPKVGITGSLVSTDAPNKSRFILFFCVCIRREVVDKIGYLDEIFNPGGCEDIDYCIRAQNAGFTVKQVPDEVNTFDPVSRLWINKFPIWHKSGQTMHDPNCLKGYTESFEKNYEILRKRYGYDLPDGYFSDNDTKTYRSLIERIPNGSRIAEIGTWKGRSLCSISDTLIKKDIKVSAIDLFQGTPGEVGDDLITQAKKMNIQEIFERNLTNFNIRDRVDVYKDDSSQSASRFPDCHFHCVFIDADHSYEAVKRDLNAWWDKVVPGGFLAGHDWMWSGVRQALIEKFGMDNIHVDECNVWYVDKLWYGYKPKVYDCFPFFNELDLLEIRLNELNNVVDKFVLVEATKTFKGEDKPLYYNENKERFSKFKDKIIHVIVDDMPSHENPWMNEVYNKDAIMRGLIGLKDEDIVHISDVDEIPNKKVISSYFGGNGIMGLKQKLCYYYINNPTKEYWYNAKIMTYKDLKQTTPFKVRNNNSYPMIPDAGYHFSYLGGVDKIVQKIESFSHSEYNNDYYKNKDRIAQAIKEGEDLYKRGAKFTPEPLDESYPTYIRENKKKYKDLIFPFKERVTAIISTKNRYFTTLPLAIMSIIGQTYKVSRLIIYDDGEHKDLREHPLWKNIYCTLERKGIPWEVVFGEGKGQVKNHQKSIEHCKTEWIWRLDDDNYAEADVLEKLIATADDTTGAVGGSVLDPKMMRHCSIASNKMEDVYLGTNRQWFEEDEIYEVDHLYSTFIYRKEAAKHGYNKDLSEVGHREETIFTYEMKRAGWKLLVNPKAITWHYRNSEGGIRSCTDKSKWAWDDSVLKWKIEKEWDIKVREPKIIVLNNGLGDHLIFKSFLNELREKYNDIILAVCYPEVFKDDTDIKLISIGEATQITDINTNSNLYKWMWDNNWKDRVELAYRRMLGL